MYGSPVKLECLCGNQKLILEQIRFAQNGMFVIRFGQ